MPTRVVPVKSLLNNPIVNFLASVKLAAVLMVVVAYASGQATFIESFQGGRDAAYDLVYAAKWFEVILGLLTFNLLVLFLKRWPYEMRDIGFAMVHISIVVILISAGITRYFGYEGVMPIREGQSSDYIYSDKPHIQAQIGNQHRSFPVRLYSSEQGPKWRDVNFADGTYELGVVGYWPNYAEGWLEGEGGMAGLLYGMPHGDHVEEDAILLGQRKKIGQVQSWYREDGLAGDMSTSPQGDLRVHVDGESNSFPVGAPDGVIHECGGYKFEILEFQTTFQVGGGTNAEGPLTNPMIRVNVTDPNGITGEKILFALHPEFSMDHSGGEEAFPGLDILYSINSGLEFAQGGETGLQGRASFELNWMDMESQQQGTFAPGEIFAVKEGIVLANQGMGFSIIPAKIRDSLVRGAVKSNHANDPPAAQIVLRDGQGNEATAVCVKHQPAQKVTLNGKEVALTFGPVVRKLSYSLYLDDFVLNTYPGSENPATYESYVLLTDKAKGIEGERVHIYMNHPLTHGGSKHFQSSYDRDLKGTVLSVNHDPGKLPTYIGYFLISLGFLLTMFRDLIWKAKKTGPQGLTSLVICLIALGFGGQALAQAEEDHTGHNHGPGVSHGTTFTVLSDPAREEAARLTIQDYRGRMKPLDTQAREMVMKVAKKTKFQGREPVDMYLNWVANPATWWDQPVIAVRYPGLKDLLGVDHAVKHVSPASLFTNGQYTLSGAVEEAHRTPDRDRTKTQRKLISFDERFNLLYMTLRGSAMRMYPVPGDANNTWVEYAALEGKVGSADVGAFDAAHQNLMTGLSTGNNSQVRQGLKEIKDLQAKFGAPVLMPTARMEAEIFYNKSHLFSWMMVPLLAAFILLMALYLWNLFRNKNRRLSLRNPFYAFGMLLYVTAFGGMIVAYTLRWVASGRAPLSNGHESLLFISLAVALAGLIFEMSYRRAAVGGLGALLTVVILGVSMLSMFDPAIGPLVPVLVSYWLNIHVTTITASYGFLGLSCLIGMLVLFLLLAKGPGKTDLKDAIIELDRINHMVVVVGLGLLTIGTLLGGVWANESWGRYWGWDAKETWSLVTILVYSVVIHFRYIPAMRSVWINAAATMLAICSVIMTYFGVNYFLTGLHSYAAGDAAQVPDWAFVGLGIMVALILASLVVDQKRKWEKTG